MRFGHIGSLADCTQAPEQHSSNFGSIGTAADVWALGCTGIQLLTGQRPFYRETRERIYEALVTKHLPPAPPAGLPAALHELLTRMLTIQPEQRPAAADVAAAIQALQLSMGSSGAASMW